MKDINYAKMKRIMQRHKKAEKKAEKIEIEKQRKLIQELFSK